MGENATVSGRFSVAIGSNAVAENRNDFVLGTSEHNVKIRGTLTVNGTSVTSDKRLKYINGENKSGLDVIKQIKVLLIKKIKKKLPESV